MLCENRIKITVELVLVRNTAYNSLQKVQDALDDGWLMDITNDNGKVIVIESIPDSQNLPP